MTSEAKVPTTTDPYKYVDFVLDCRVPDGYGTVAIIAKNPALTDAGNATASRVRRACERLQLHPFLFNLFALRGDPTDLAEAVAADPDGAVGPHNDCELSNAIDVDLVIAAWSEPQGVDRLTYDRRVGEVMDLIGVDRFVCFGTTTDGYPLGPLDWNDRARPTEYALPCAGQRS